MKPRLPREITIGLAAAAACSAFAVPVAEASFPGANGRIAFGAIEVHDTEDYGLLDGWYDVASMDADGRGRRLVASGASDPAFSPDGRTLATTGERRGGTGIFLRRSGGRRIARLTRGYDYEPSWSPSGRRVAFARFSSRRSDVFYGFYEHVQARIYSVRRDGRDLRLVAENGFDPAWSSRGEIAYEFRSKRMTSEREANIRVTGPRGTRTLVRGAYDPDWSPRGDKLVFARCRGENCGIFVINRDGTGLHRLAVRGWSAASPVWSPDGRWIAFCAGYSSPSSWVRRVSALGGQRRILLPPGWYPNWVYDEYQTLSTVALTWQPRTQR